MSAVDQPNEITESDPNGAGPDGLSGDMGVSSERVGKVRGSTDPKTHGVESIDSDPVLDPPPEQAAR